MRQSVSTKLIEYSTSRELFVRLLFHYSDVITGALASQITGVSIVCSTVFFSSADQRKYQSSASRVFVKGIHQWSVVSLTKSVTRNMFPFFDVIIFWCLGVWYRLIYPHIQHYHILATNPMLVWSFHYEHSTIYYVRGDFLLWIWNSMKAYHVVHPCEKVIGIFFQNQIWSRLLDINGFCLVYIKRSIEEVKKMPNI